MWCVPKSHVQPYLILEMLFEEFHHGCHGNILCRVVEIPCLTWSHFIQDKLEISIYLFLDKYKCTKLIQFYTGQPRYVKLAYLEYMAYVEVIIHSRAVPLYCLVFKTCLCRTQLSRNLGYIEVVFHSRKIIFHYFTTICVELKFVLVKKLNNKNVNKVINLQTSNNSL